MATLWPREVILADPLEVLRFAGAEITLRDLIRVMPAEGIRTGGLLHRRAAIPAFPFVVHSLSLFRGVDACRKRLLSTPDLNVGRERPSSSRAGHRDPYGRGWDVQNYARVHQMLRRIVREHAAADGIDSMHRTSADYLIVGAGIAGLTLARKLAAGGARVALVDRGSAARGAAFVAAGMLSPLVEARVEERELVAFGYEALRYYPGFVDELQAESRMDLGYRDNGTLIVAVDRDDSEQLRHQFEEQRALGLPVEWRNGFECRRIEPYLAPGVPGGIFSPLDHQLDNRSLLRALYEVCIASAQIELLENAGDGLLEPAGAGGWSFQSQQYAVDAPAVVVATGARADLLERVVPGLARVIRPVKGQILRLDQSQGRLLEHTVRTPEVYLVPKTDGTLVVGASSEDRGFDESVTAGETLDRLRSAWECVPGIYELPLVDISVGFRPAARDHAPLLGSCGPDGLSLAMGYYRHGVLLAPYAAEILAARLLRGEGSDWLRSFSPERFHEDYSERAVAR